MSLPNTYLPLDYIESTGTQFIRTDIYAVSGDVIEICGNFTKADDSTTQILCGCHRTGYYRKVLCVRSDGSAVRFSSSAGAWNESTQVSDWSYWGTPFMNADTSEHVFKFSEPDISMTVDGVRYALESSSNRQQPGNSSELYKMILFANCHDSLTTMTDFAYFRLKYAKFWNNSNLARDYAPALRLSDGKAGLYDSVSQTFFTNANSSGPDFSFQLYNYKAYLNDDSNEYCSYKIMLSNNLTYKNFIIGG